VAVQQPSPTVEPQHPPSESVAVPQPSPTVEPQHPPSETVAVQQPSSTVEPQHPPSESVAVPQPSPTVEPQHPPSETVAVQQPTDVPAALSTVPQADAASQLATSSDQQPTTSDVSPVTEQQLPNTATPDSSDQQPVNVTVVPGDDQQKVVEPAQQQVLPTELTTVQSHSLDVASGAAGLQQPCPPSVGDVSVTTTQPSANVETQPAAAAQVGESEQQEVIQVQQPTDVMVDEQAQHEDVVKATLNGVDDVSAASDTDDATELISDSLSRDRDAINQHDHQHPSVGHHYFMILSLRLSILLLLGLILWSETVSVKKYDSCPLIFNASQCCNIIALDVSHIR